MYSLLCFFVYILRSSSLAVPCKYVENLYLEIRNVINYMIILVF